MPVFIAMYDQCWQLMCRIALYVELLLKAKIKLLPALWAWHVNHGQGGWAAHRDKSFNTIGNDGWPKSLTAWVALSNVGPDDACIYAIPAFADPNYPASASIEIKNIQSIRALPASAGTCLLWNQNILHWGGKLSSWSTEARVSIAFEYQRSDILPYNTPLLAANALPSVQTRLRIIAKQLLQFKHMYQMPIDVESAAIACQ